MKTRIFAGMMCLCFIAEVGLVNLAQAEDKKKAFNPSIEQQLEQIIKSQKVIEQRISNLEAKQNTIVNAFSAFASALHPGQAGPGSGCGSGSDAQAALPPSEDFSKVYNIPLGHSLLKGNKNAKATIVEFSDFQCPFSQRFHPVVTEVMKTYPNDVNYLFKSLPLISIHPQAKPAVKAALAAREQGKYWEMVEALFQNGRELSEAKYEEIAKNLGLNVEKFKKDLKERDAEWEKLIQEDSALADNVDARGTPTFYLNGKKTTARDTASFKTEIDKILKEKK